MLAPIGVKESHVDIRPQNTYGLERLPGIAVFVGSNDGTTWTLIRSVTNNSGALNTYTRYNVNATQAYKYIRIIWNKLTTAGTTTSFRDRAAASEIKIFGSEEGDVSTDSTWTSVLNKPGTQQLEVYWDGADSNSYPGAGTEVFDLSGNGFKGTIAGNNGFDAEYNAWVFDGSGDYISGTLSNPAGAWVHSTSFWYRQDSVVTANWDYIYHIGTSTAGEASLFALKSDGYLAMANYSNSSVRRAFVPTLGQWYHISVVYSGGGVNVDNVSIYLDGKEITLFNQGDATAAVSLAANTSIKVGSDAGGGNTTHGSIANFRLFGKTLNADQVRELYEYDAPRFGHRQNLVSLHKGNLGVGVNHPTSRLEIAGTETIQEYPPRAMTDYETYMEGHGVFRASSSSLRNGHETWQAFDKGTTGKWPSDAGGGDTFGGTDNAYNGTNQLSSSTAFGAWLKLELPYKILLKTFSVYSSPNSEQPEDFIIYGSMDDNTWEHVFTKTGAPQNSDYVSYDVNSVSHYNYFAFIITRTISSGTIGVIDEWKLFGAPDPSSLEDGHLT